MQVLSLCGEIPSNQGRNNGPRSGGGPSNPDPDRKHNQKEGVSSSNNFNGGTGTLDSGQKAESLKSGPADNGSSKTQGHTLFPRDKLVDSDETEISFQAVVSDCLFLLSIGSQ